jgi:hypothetical protein
MVCISDLKYAKQTKGLKSPPLIPKRKGIAIMEMDQIEVDKYFDELLPKLTFLVKLGLEGGSISLQLISDLRVYFSPHLC